MNEQPTALEVVPRRKRLPTAAERNEWARRYRESGLSVLQFCDEHKLLPQSLYRWLSKSRSSQGTAVVPASSHPSALFTEIKVERASASSTWAAEVQRPGGAVLRVAANAPAALVEQLLRVC
jgi:transposase-like protein